MSPLRDFRTPADPQDFESLYNKGARPPRDFRVTKDAGSSLCIFQFQDFSGALDRDPTVGYKAYFVPLAMASVAQVGKPENRQAAICAGRVAAPVSANGRGEWITLSSPDFAGLKGHYIAVGVNRRGIESEPTIAFPSPYGTAP